MTTLLLYYALVALGVCIGVVLTAMFVISAECERKDGDGGRR